MEQLGTIDFYPGAPGYYGHDQPGCYDIFNVVSCSHSRSIEIFQSSIVKATCLAGKVRDKCGQVKSTYVFIKLPQQRPTMQCLDRAR